MKKGLRMTRMSGFGCCWVPQAKYESKQKKLSDYRCDISSQAAVFGLLTDLNQGPHFVLKSGGGITAQMKKSEP